jgi:hypothetical protein
MGVLVVVNPDLVRAIREKRLIELVYRSGRHRTVEPHDYGVKGGADLLLVYQLDGASRSGASEGWKLLAVNLIRDLHVLDDRFQGSRADHDQQHHIWDTLFARVP